VHFSYNNVKATEVILIAVTVAVTSVIVTVASLNKKYDICCQKLLMKTDELLVFVGVFVYEK
jgi:hypothetical protein